MVDVMMLLLVCLYINVKLKRCCFFKMVDVDDDYDIDDDDLLNGDEFLHANW